MLVGFVGYSAIYIMFSHVLGYKFRPHYFLLYYLVYSPVWLDRHDLGAGHGLRAERDGLHRLEGLSF